MKYKMDHTRKPRLLLERPDPMPSMYVNDISRLFMHRVRHECEKQGIPHGYHRLLMELANEEGATQLQLVKLTRLTAPTVSVALTKMESDGLVKRIPDEKDMRQMKVYLTDAGKEKVKLVRKTFRETDALIAKDIPKDELDAAMKVMRKMLINLLEEEDK